VKGFGKVGWVVFIAGTVAFVLACAVLPWVLIRMGMHPRTATGHSLSVMLLVAPVGMLVAGAEALALQGLRWTMPVWAGNVLLLPLPSVVNGFFWGAVAERIAWARVHARVFFWVLVLGLGVYWCFLLALFYFVR
jgi:hypothetical protein